MQLPFPLHNDGKTSWWIHLLAGERWEPVVVS